MTPVSNNILSGLIVYLLRFCCCVYEKTSDIFPVGHR